MYYCVLTGFIALLISGKAWISFATMAVAGLVVVMLKSRCEEIMKRYGGVTGAKVINSVCYGSDKGDCQYTEYTVLVSYRNGNKIRYTLSPNQELFKALSPYMGKA